MKFKLLFCLLLFCLSSLAQKEKQGANDKALPRPKLVVGLVVDQMRWDYLYRYYKRYNDNGFKRMLNDGFTCENTNIDYVPTVTAIGHSTVYTGSVPSIHGIAGNNFIIQASGKNMYCTEDSTVQGVGSSSAAGNMSPKNLLSSTITDELRLATNFRSKTIGISLKDRGAILSVGHAGNAAYWFDDVTGNWISSTWYMDELPAWVKKFNSQKNAEKYLKQNWNTLYPIATYVQSTEDDVPYERAFKGSGGSIFPINTSELLLEQGVGLIRTTPYGNTFTFDLAKNAILNEKLGQNEVTDFLAVSLSSPDYLGHRFGPNSIEVEDSYLRLDKDLGDFLSFLDEKIGKDNYTIFLTADHGAAHNINFLLDHKIPAGVFKANLLLEELNELLKKEFQVNDLVLGFQNYQINLNNALINNHNLDISEIKELCIKFMENQEGVAFIVDSDNVVTANIPDLLRSRIVNGFHPERSGVIQIIPKPGWYSGSDNSKGTSHGVWNPYDAHIPLVWMGWGIKSGRMHRPTFMTDISATLAALLRIQVPNGCIGQPISEVLK